MEDEDIKNYIVTIITVIIILLILVVVLINNTDIDNKIKQTLIQKCDNYNTTQHFNIIKQYLIFSSFAQKNIYLYNYTNETYVCKADIEMCSEGLRLCFDGAIFSEQINYTINK